MPKALRRSALFTTVLVLTAMPSLAGVRSRLAGLIEEATGLNVVAIEKVKAVAIGDPETPSAIKMPARTEMQLVCRIVAGKMDCYQAAIEICPDNVILSQDSGSYQCDLDCHGNTPDPSGQCECDVRYDTCKPFP